MESPKEEEEVSGNNGNHVEEVNNCQPKRLSTSTSFSKFTSKKPKRSAAFIAVHLGAGEHSPTKFAAYKLICEKACEEAKLILENGGSADEAVKLATVIIEDSELVNAGKGSSLTNNKTVEGDAGFMNGKGFFGGVGAVPGVQNPILVAMKIAEMHEKQPLLECGIVPPTFLVGEGAKAWAQSNGIPVCDNDQLVSKRAAKLFTKYSTRVSEAKDEDILSSEISDTVGAIALDVNGNVASAVSSGGNWLKNAGRVGHAPLFGCGCWASNGDNTSANPTIAASSSGSGELLSKVHLPAQIAKEAKRGEFFSLVESMKTVISTDFLENDLLKIHKDAKNVGIIALLWEGCRGEFVWGHTSKNFVVAYSSAFNKSISTKISSLPDNSEPGKSLKVEGISFK